MTSWQSGERADCCLEVRLLRAEPGAWNFVRWWTFFFPLDSQLGCVGDSSGRVGKERKHA